MARVEDKITTTKTISRRESIDMELTPRQWVTKSGPRRHEFLAQIRPGQIQYVAKALRNKTEQMAGIFFIQICLYINAKYL